MTCDLNTSNTPLPSGTPALDVLNNKKSAYTKNPQTSLYLPCNILGDFFNPVFGAIIGNDPLQYGINFFAADEKNSPDRFTPQQYAEALDAGFKRKFPGSTTDNNLTKLSEGLYSIFGGVETAMTSVALGLASLYPSPLSQSNREKIGAELVRLAIEKNIQGLGELGKALNTIGFALQDIPSFLKDKNLLVQIIGKEIFPLTDIPTLIALLNNPLLWPGLSDDDRKKAILQFLWNDLQLKNNLSLFKDAFQSLGFETFLAIASVMKTLLKATLPQVVQVLQDKNFSTNEITSSVFQTFSQTSDSITTKTNLVIEIFQAMTSPKPTNNNIVDSILSLAPSLSDSTTSIYETLTKILNQFESNKLTIATILKAQGQSALQISTLLKVINVPSENIAQILNNLNYDINTIAQSLFKTGVSADKIALILSTILNKSPQQIAIALSSLNIPIAELLNILASLNIQTNILIDILKSLNLSNQEIITILKIVGKIKTSISTGQVTGTITPHDLILKLVVNPEVNVISDNNGSWSTSIGTMDLENDLYILQLLTSGITIHTTNLLVVDGTYIIFEGDASIDTIATLLNQANFSLEQKVRILLKLGANFEQIKKLLNIKDAQTLGQILGLIFSTDSSLDFLLILTQITSGSDAESIGTIIGEALKIMNENGTIALHTAKQVEEFIRATKLNRDDVMKALEIALKILGIPFAINIFIGIKQPRCQKSCFPTVERDLTDYVSNDNASFIYKIDARKAIGSAILKDTIVNYNPQNLICNHFSEDTFKYVVENSNHQTDEGVVTIKIFFE